MIETLTVINGLSQKMREVTDLGRERIEKLLKEHDHKTDLGNAVRLINKHGNHLRYSTEMGKWYVWTGHKWEADKSQRVRTMAFDTIRDMYKEASRATSDTERSELVAWAVQSENATRISSMISLAQAFVTITVEDMDSDPYVLNLRNGVLDLQTGDFITHDPAFMLTKMAPVAYDENAECPLWTSFLNRIMDGNEGLIDFLQRAVGYSLTGCTTEHVLFFLYGSGANGKSTFLNTLMNVLGDYAKPTDPDLLLSKQGESHPTGVADLRGARMAITNEIEDGKRLAENLVKQLTGGDRLKARYMRQDFFDFLPTHKLWIAGNYKPVIRGVDEGIWRRMRLVPFNVTIPPEERDKHLEAKLKKEYHGILRWAIDGAMKWRESGLTYPEEVRAAVDQYRSEQDALSGFLEEECVISPTVKAPKAILYKAYVTWCEENGQHPYSHKRLTQTILQRFDVREQKSGSTRYLAGIGLLNY